MMNEFLNAIMPAETPDVIHVYFKGSAEPVEFTINSFEMLKTEPDVIEIVDPTTCEIIFDR